MRMLANLKEILDDIERDDEWAHRFVSDMLIRQEEGRLNKLTPKQFTKLVEIHDKYCG